MAAWMNHGGFSIISLKGMATHFEHPKPTCTIRRGREIKDMPNFTGVPFVLIRVGTNQRVLDFGARPQLQLTRLCYKTSHSESYN